MQTFDIHENRLLLIKIVCFFIDLPMSINSYQNFTPDNLPISNFAKSA